MKKNSFSLINFVFYIINIIGCILLLFSYLANFITPDKFTFAAYCGMLYPYLLATNTFFVIYWALQRKRFAFLSLIGILIGYTFIQTSLKFYLTMYMYLESMKETIPIKTVLFLLLLNNNPIFFAFKNIFKTIKPINTTVFLKAYFKQNTNIWNLMEIIIKSV